MLTLPDLLYPELNSVSTVILKGQVGLLAGSVIEIVRPVTEFIISQIQIRLLQI
jgi:hypothetical protein